MKTFKFQLDLSGTTCLIYDKKEIDIMEVTEPEIIKVIVDGLDLKPMTKKYAKASISDEGMLGIGDKVPNQNW